MTDERLMIDALDAQAQAEAKLAEHRFQAAFEMSDGAGMATAQRELARAEAKAVRLEESRGAAELRLQRPADPVEAFISQRTAPTAAWLREHKDWITDPAKADRLTKAHHHALSEGRVVDSPSYFESVETFIGLRGGGSARRSSHQHEARRSSHQLEELPDGAVKLSKREVETAEALGLTLKEYVRRRKLMDNDPDWHWRD
jgi:hypothetical protein